MASDSAKQRLLASLPRTWYGPSRPSLGLKVLALLYAGGVAVRRLAYRTGLLRSTRVGSPVIVVGNIVAGGTGKTPVVIWLATLLGEAGYSPGIVCRGYGGRASRWPQPVGSDSATDQVGDEAVLLARRGRCPVAAGRDRVQAASLLCEKDKCDVIISDDGLQHYGLHRDIEIVVVDAARQFGNRWPLPAGPLREPLSRLQGVDWVVSNGPGEPAQITMKTTADQVISLGGHDANRSLSDFQGQRLHAVCGLGNPQRFFQTLTDAGLDFESHAFGDHHNYTPKDLFFDDARPILMTEKDAVKCEQLGLQNAWFVPITAEFEDGFGTALVERLETLAWSRTVA